MPTILPIISLYYPRRKLRYYYFYEIFMKREWKLLHCAWIECICLDFWWVVICSYTYIYIYIYIYTCVMSSDVEPPHMHNGGFSFPSLASLLNITGFCFFFYFSFTSSSSLLSSLSLFCTAAALIIVMLIIIISNLKSWWCWWLGTGFVGITVSCHNHICGMGITNLRALIYLLSNALWFCFCYVFHVFVHLCSVN